MTRQTTLRILLLLLLAATASAAQPDKPASPLPKNPAALLALAAQRNGLSGPNLKPWHIQATYQLYDAKGNPTEKGTFEEWWAAPDQYKLTFDDPGGASTLYVTPKGTYLAGAHELQHSEFLLLSWLFNPIPTRRNLRATKLVREMQKYGKLKFDCVNAIPQPRGGVTTGVSRLYCLSANNPVLRFVADQAGVGILYQSIARIEGHYLGSDLLISENGVPVIKSHLVSGEVLTRPANSFFALPASATGHLQPTLINADGSSGLVIGHKISGRAPNYPSAAKFEDQQGTVSLEGLIGIDGRLHHLRVISSPSISLSRSAMAAVKTWRYAPYKLAGVPVNVETIINIVYTLDRGM